MSLTLDPKPDSRLDAQPRRETPRVLRQFPTWCVAQTHPAAERWAASNLQRLGFKTYFPLCAVRVRDRVIPTLTRIVQRPLFHGYIFVQHASPDLWRPIREAPGVAAVVRSAGCLEWVADGAVEALQALDAVRATPPPPGASIAVGDAVRVASGPVKDAEAVVTAVHGDMAQIALMMLGQIRNLTLPLACLAAREWPQTAAIYG